MQSVLKDIVLDGPNSYKVLQSSIMLEIFNGVEAVTIRRSVVNEKRKPQLVDIIKGECITVGENNFDITQMYLHDRGSATDETYGFHAFLEKYIGWNLPNVIDTVGNKAKLYFPLVAPAFIIEQKSGWSSFFATIPYYNVRNAEERVIEFLLNLDVFKNEQSKISLGIDKKLLQDRWGLLYQEFITLAKKGNAEVIGMEDYPKIINDINEIYFRVYKKDKYYLVPQLLQELQIEFDLINNETEITVGDNLEKNQTRLQELSDNLLRYNFRFEQLENEVLHEKEKLKQYIQQKKNVEEDLSKNKSAQKMHNLGGQVHSSISSSICPTCGQNIKDSLLPADVDRVPMQIGENINFLSSQQKMIEVYVNSQRKSIIEKETIVSEYGNYLTALRQQIRNIKKDLVADDRVPSEELIERKINTKRSIAFYAEMVENINELKKKLKKMSKEWDDIKRSEANMAGNFFSTLDAQKLEFMEGYFLSLMKKFNYQSKDKDAIKISREKYLPVIEVKLPNERPKTYDIRFDSSGSDHIRCMWAYYIALLGTSNKFSGNHPNLLIFDEPQQQSASTTDFHEFLDELSKSDTSQSIVFASFQNSLSDFVQATQDLNFNRIDGNGMFIVKT